MNHFNTFWKFDSFSCENVSHILFIKVSLRFLRGTRAMLSEWSCKILLTSKFSYLLFHNPTHKTKTATASRWGTANRPETNLLCFALLCLLPPSANCAKMLGQNHFEEPNQHGLTFLHPVLICRMELLLGVVRLQPWNTKVPISRTGISEFAIPKILLGIQYQDQTGMFKSWSQTNMGKYSKR